MVFAPKLDGGVAYEQPVQAPNAMSAIAGLFNFGIESLASAGGGEAPKPTEGDKFDAAIGEFVNSKGGAFSWDKKSAREFIFQNPQFAPEMKAYLEGGGVFDTPEAVAEESATKWFETPEGMMAVASTEGLSPEDRDAELARRVTVAKQQEAELARLQRETATLEAEGTLTTKRWDALKPTSKDMVDDTVSTVLAPIVQEVMNGVTVDVPEELKQLLGIRYSTIDMSNLPAVLADTKNYLGKQARGAYVNNFGEDVLPSEDWNKEVFGSIDGLIEIGKAIDSPQERAAAMQAIIESGALKRLDDSGIAVSLEILKSVPPESAAGLLALPALDGPLREILAVDGVLLGSKQIAEGAASLSVKEAKDVATDTIQIIDKGITPAFFTAFKESAKRSGFNVVDSNSFKSIISNNIEEIKKLSTSNPEFRAEMSDFLNADIQQTISVIKSNLIAGVSIQFDGKQFVMVPEKGTLAEQKWNDTYRPYKKSAENQLPDGMNLDTLNEKLGALGLLGDVGKEVQESIGMLNAPEVKASAGAGREITPRGRGRGRGAAGGPSASVEPDWWTPIKNGIFAGESGGDYNALFGYSNREGGKFAGKKLTDMTVDEALAFAAPSGEYGSWVKGQIGRVATPMGAYQIVGTTLRAAKEGLGLTGDEVMTTELQDKLGMWIYEQQGTGAWEGYAGPRDSYESYAGGGTAAGETRMGESPMIALDSGAAGIPTTPKGPSTASTEGLKGTPISYDSPEVQKLIEMSQSAPQEVVKMAKELLSGKPIDPQVKALIEALVRIGEK